MNDRIISNSGRFFAEIYHDDYPEDPRDYWCEFGTIVTNRRWPTSIGDEVADGETWIKPADSVALPLYCAYDGSGQVWTGSESELPRRGMADDQIGVIYVDRAEARALLDDGATDDQIRGVLAGRIETLSRYLEGDVWSYMMWKTPDGMDPDDVDTTYLESCASMHDLYGYDYAVEFVESELAAMDRELVK